MRRGRTKLVQHPGKFPYVPGGDCCGVVQDLDGPKSGEQAKFKVGDHVIFFFGGTKPLGSLAEYRIVKQKFVALKPNNMTDIEAACIPSSSLAAMVAVEKLVHPGTRILVLGGSGGVGTTFVQLARNAGASYIATTSTQVELMESLGVDRCIDYTKENWWDIEEYKRDKFDVIFDLVSDRENWKRANSSGVLKNGWNGGLFAAVIIDTPHPKVRNYFDMASLVFRILRRTLGSKLWKFGPSYHVFGFLDISDGRLDKLVQLVEEEKFKLVLDPSSPYPFTTEAVHAAFRLQASRHAHGKVVIDLSATK